MTADHWITVVIGIMNVIAVLAAAIMGPVVASRISQPKPKLETANPYGRTWLVQKLKPLKSFRFWLVMLMLVNIYALRLDMRPGPLTKHAVLDIALQVAVIGFLLAMLFVLEIFKLIEKMLDCHVSLHGIVRDIFDQLDGPAEPPQT